MTGTAAGCWVVRTAHTTGKTQAVRKWNVECSLCGRTDVKTERQILNLIAARKAMGHQTVRGCHRGCRTQRAEVSPGDKFGLWTVLPGVPRKYLTTLKYPVVCECGKRQHVAVSALRKGAAGLPGGSGGCRSCANKRQWAERQRPATEI